MKCVGLLWCWWTERNKANRGERRASTSELTYTVTMHVSEWKTFLRKTPKKAPEMIQVWNPPPADWVMLNTDGAFVQSTGRGGWGAIARDCTGDMIVAEAGTIPVVADALHSETVAVLKAIAMAARLGCGRIIVATDCQNLQQAITSNEYDLSPLGGLFLEAKFMLRTEFLAFKIKLFTYPGSVINQPMLLGH